MSRHQQNTAVDRITEKGTILILVAMGMTTLMGFMGLALDVGQFYNHKRYMQTAADAGAVAGASEIMRGRLDLVVGSAWAATSTNRFTNGSDGVVVTVNRPPLSGYYVTDPDFVEVVITQPSPTYFMRVLGWNSVEVPARAVAGIAGIGKACLYALDPNDPEAFEAESSAILSAPNCGIQVNSQHACAFQMESNSQVTARNIDVAGGVCDSSAYNPVPAPKTNAVPLPDPLAYLPTPDFGAGCDYGPGGTTDPTPFKRTSSSNPTIVLPRVNSQGLPYAVFCNGMMIEDGNVNLIPGLYILKGTQADGSLEMKGGSLTCTSCTGGANGVTFFLTGDGGNGLAGPYPYKPIKIANSSTVQLRAPTAGPYAGLLIMDDRKVPEGWDPSDPSKVFEHKFESSTSSYLEGGLYFPNHVLNLESNTTSTTAAAYSFIVARIVKIESNVSWNLQSNYTGLGPNNPLKRMTLVE